MTQRDWDLAPNTLERGGHPLSLPDLRLSTPSEVAQ